MTDWTDIHKDFTDELQVQWEKNGFNFAWQIEEWIDAGLEPEDADFALYIENQGYTVDDLKEKVSRLNRLREKYDKGEEMIDDFSSEEEEEETCDREEDKIQTKKVRLSNHPNHDWKNIHLDFTTKLIELWQNLYFTYEQAKEWINIGFQPSDADFFYWIRKVKKFTLEQVLNEHNLGQLREEYQQHFIAKQIGH